MKALILVFAASFLNLIAIGVYKSIVGSTMSSYLITFNVLPAQAGLLFTFNFIGNSISVLLGSFAADRFGKKPLLIIGNLLLATGATFFALAANYYQSLIAILFIGAGAGIVANLSRAILTDFDFKRIGSILNFSGIFVTIGALITPLVVRAFLIIDLNWQHSYFLLTGFALISFVFFYLIIFPVKGQKNQHFSFQKLKELLKSPIVRLLALAMAFYMGGEVSLFGWSDVFFQQVHGVNPETSKFYLSAFWTIMIAGRLAYSFLLRYCANCVVLKIIAPGSFLGIIGMVLAPNPNSALFFFLVTAFFLSGFYNTILSNATDYYSNYISSIFGIVLAGGAVGVIFIPWLIGILEGFFGLTTAYIFNSIPYGLLIVIFWLIIKQAPEKPSKI